VIHASRYVRLLMLLVLALSFVIPAQAVSAADTTCDGQTGTNKSGEVGDYGDTNSISDVFIKDDRPTMCIDRTGLCVLGVATCTIKIQWHYQCGWPWCTSWQIFPAKTVLGKYVQADCGDRDGKWRADYIVSYSGNGGSLMEFYGELEAYLNSGGSVSYKLIAELFYNASLKAGTKTGTKVTSSGATSYTYDQGEIASTGGRNINTC